MFIDIDQWTDDELFARVREGEEARRFISSLIGKKILERAKEKHKLVVMALTQMAVDGCSLSDPDTTRALEKILRDIATPALVMQSIQELLVDAERSEALLKQRDIEDL